MAGLSVFSEAAASSLGLKTAGCSPDGEPSRSGNLSLGLEDVDRRRSKFGELMIQAELIPF